MNDQDKLKASIKFLSLSDTESELSEVPQQVENLTSCTASDDSFNQSEEEPVKMQTLGRTELTKDESSEWNSSSSTINNSNVVDETGEPSSDLSTSDSSVVDNCKSSKIIDITESNSSSRLSIGNPTEKKIFLNIT